MKKTIAILLSFLIGSQSIGLEITDFFLLKDLVEHAQYHSEEYGDDFFTFLQKHYGPVKDSHQHAGENKKHDNLPFQHQDCNHLVAEVVFTNLEFPIKNPVISIEDTSNFRYKNLYNSLEKFSIFQPPKHA